MNNSKSVNMLLTEIAISLLGNQFYDNNGECVEDLQALHEIGATNQPPNQTKKMPNLMQLLGISEETLNAAKTDPSARHNSQENIIDLDGEDEDFVRKESINTNSEQGNLNRSTSSSEDMSKNIESTKSNVIESYVSNDPLERVKYIIKTTAVEFQQMKQQSETSLKTFMETNRSVMNFDSIKKEDLFKPYYVQQQLNLMKESNDLMQFIKIIKNDEQNEKAILLRVADDILRAKDLIS